MPLALEGLLKQAFITLKPPVKRRGPPGREEQAKAAAPAGARRSLVHALLVLLERATLLARQPGGHNLRKVRTLNTPATCPSASAAPSASGSPRPDPRLPCLQDTAALLALAFQREPWLWELLIRKHLPNLLAQPGAATAVLEAVCRLDSSAQARAYSLLHRQLVAAAQQERAGGQQAEQLCLPPAVQDVLLKQLGTCLHARAGAGDPWSGLDWGGREQHPTAHSGEQAEEAEEQVVLAEFLPALLHLLLAATCSSAGGPAAAAELRLSSGQRAGCTDAGVLPACSTGAASGSQATVEPAAPAAELGQAGAARAPCAGSNAASASQAVLARTVQLASLLSDPDAVHDMLMLGQLSMEGLPSEVRSAAAAEPAQQPGADAGERLSAAQVRRVCITQALLEVCVEALLTLPVVAAAASQRMRRKQQCAAGSSERQAPATCSSSCDAKLQQAQQADGQQQQDLQVAGLVATMLAVHRELAKLLAALGAGRAAVPLVGPPADICCKLRAV